MDKAQSFAMQYGYYDKGKKKACCVGYNAGYKQAEKDLALTWIDIRNILSIAREVEDENDDCPLLKSELCDEILKRFNEQRKK